MVMLYHGVAYCITGSFVEEIHQSMVYSPHKQPLIH